MQLKYKPGIVFLILILALQVPAFNQVTVTGPTCINPRTMYQYVITGPWDSVSTMQICLTGGVVAGSAITCTQTGPPQASVMVSWNGGIKGTLQVHSSKGNASISIVLTDTLTGGAIADTTKAQRIGYLALPSIVHCPPSTGGSCTPNYSYQWQQSLDMVAWTNITGATLQNLVMTQTLKQTTFVRRKVTETSSNTVAYSNAALVDVGAPAPSAVAL
jgi:hypothetical protein